MKTEEKVEHTEMPTNSFMQIWRLSKNPKNPADLVGRFFKTPNGKTWTVESRGISESFDAMTGASLGVKEHFGLEEVKIKTKGELQNE